jgi:hypothetical protein
MSNFNLGYLKNKNFNNVRYVLKINSKDRNFLREPNPFDFNIKFNKITNYTYIDNNGEKQKISLDGIAIDSVYENVKKISVEEICIPPIIETNIPGKLFDNIYLVKIANNKYIIQNDCVNLFIKYTENTIELGKHLKLVSYSNYNFFDKEKCCFLYINNNVMIIDSILNGVITLANNSNSNLTKQDLVLADFNRELLFSGLADLVLSQGYISSLESGSNFGYLLDILNKDSLLLIKSPNMDTSLPDNYYVIKYNNIIDGKLYVDFLEKNNNNDNTDLIEIFLLNNYKYDSLKEKVYYLQIEGIVHNKNTSSDENINKSIGVFLPSRNSDDYTLLMGHSDIEFNDNDLRNISSLKIKLLDSMGNDIGDYYKNMPLHKLKKKINQINMSISLNLYDKQHN